MRLKSHVPFCRAVGGATRLLTLIKPTTCTIVYRPSKWYASITVKCVPKRETGSGAIGLDFGCKTAIAKSDGEKITPPKFLASASAEIKRLSKDLRRKRKPERKKCHASRRWKKAQAKVSKLQKEVAALRQNWVHHQAVEIVSSARRGSVASRRKTTICANALRLIATEKLSLKGMTRKAKKGSKRKRQKTGLNRSILDVGIGMLKQAIKYKATEAGAIYLEAPTRSLKPTQRCNQCWKITKKTLSDRLHVCSNPKCNHTEDRECDSAQVCLAWARGQELSPLDGDGSSSTASPKRKSCGGMKQLAQMKRQKLMARAE